MGLYQSAFLEHRLDKASFQAEEPKLRAQLLEAQLALVERRDFPVLILVTGMDGAGKGGVIQRLYEWLDPRHLRTNGYDAPGRGRAGATLDVALLAGPAAQGRDRGGLRLLVQRPALRARVPVPSTRRASRASSMRSPASSACWPPRGR